MIRGITITYTGVANVGKKELRAIVGEAMEEAVRFWHRSYLPRHFRHGGGVRYRYQRRTKRWNIRKRRETGRSIPLVYTGTMARRVKSSLEVRRPKTLARATAIMSGPRYLHMRPTGNRPDMMSEILTTTGEERRSMADLVHRLASNSLVHLKADKKLMNLRRKRIVKITGA